MEQWINLPLAVSLKKMPSLYLLKNVYCLWDPGAIIKKNITAPWGKYIFHIIIPEGFQNLSLESGKKYTI